jgi:hypothetical protein
LSQSQLVTLDDDICNTYIGIEHQSHPRSEECRRFGLEFTLEAGYRDDPIDWIELLTMIDVEALLAMTAIAVSLGVAIRFLNQLRDTSND